MSGSTITTYDSPHVFEQNTGTSIKVQTPNELLDDAGEKHKYNLWENQIGQSQSEIATRRIQHQVDSDEILSAVFEPARRVQLENSLEGGIVIGGTVTYSGTTGSSYDNYDFYHPTQTKIINSNVSNGTQGTNWTFWKWSDGNTNQQRNIIVNQDIDLEAEFKGLQVTDTHANNGATGQRKIVRTADGFLHRVYESLGHIWYEVKSPTGDWELVSNINGKHIDENGGKSPSISVSSISFPDPNNVTIVWQQGGNIIMQTFEADNGSYTWHMDASFSTGISSSYDTKPNIAWSGINEFTVIWHTTSGIKFRVYYIGGTFPYYGYFSLRASGTISGTNSSSINAAISADKDFPYSIYELAWVQNGTGGASSIKYKTLYTDEVSTSYQYPTTPITVSSSSDFSNMNVSIMTTPDYAVIGWACRSTSYWSPMSSRACLRTYDGASLSSFSTFNQSVASVSLAKSGTVNDYYLAWSEKYYYPESQYNNDVNKYVKKGAFSNKRTLNTTAPNIQLYHAPSGNDMKLSAFYSGTPNYYVLSNSLETTSKAASETSLQARGIHVNKKDEAGAYFEIGSILIDNEQIQFVEIPEVVTGENRFNRTQNKDSLIEKKLEDVTPFLISEPFNLSEESSFTFTEQFSIGDSLALTNVLGKNGELSFSVELVNESNTRVVATLKSVKMSSKSLKSQKEKGYQVNIPKELSGRFRVRITPESNLEDFSFELATSYRDDSSQSGKEKVKLDLEEVNVILAYDLGQNYPNPFNPSTQIQYQIPNAGLVQLEVFDILGRKVQTLVNETKEVGKYTVTFDASGLASGVYLYRLTSGKFMASKKLFLVK
ncbi:MAG: T9SS type A sorting domain-containing protein [Balneolaceae bacterium]